MNGSGDYHGLLPVLWGTGARVLGDEPYYRAAAVAVHHFRRPTKLMWLRRASSPCGITCAPPAARQSCQAGSACVYRPSALTRLQVPPCTTEFRGQTRFVKRRFARITYRLGTTITGSASRDRVWRRFAGAALLTRLRAL